MAYTQQDRLTAYNIFLETGSIEEVVKRTTIARKTLFRWKKDENWDGLVKEFKETVRRKLEQSGLTKYVIKDENLLGVARILFQMGYNSIRPTVRDEEGNIIPNENRILPGSLSDVITLITKSMAIQSEVLGRTVEEVSDRVYTEEEVKAINKILLKGQTYDADEDRRKAAEEFRNRQARTSSGILS